MPLFAVYFSFLGFYVVSSIESSCSSSILVVAEKMTFIHSLCDLSHFI